MVLIALLMHISGELIRILLIIAFGIFIFNLVVNTIYNRGSQRESSSSEEAT
jgi:hypothetical protein